MIHNDSQSRPDRWLSLCMLAIALPVSAQSTSDAESAVKKNPLKEAYFGETHVHTGVSMDAFIAGNRLTPDDAYRFAKGEEMMVNGSSPWEKPSMRAENFIPMPAIRVIPTIIPTVPAVAPTTREFLAAKMRVSSNLRGPRRVSFLT